MKQVKLKLSESQIKAMSKEEFNKLVKEKVRQAALLDLLETKTKQSKMNNLEYSECKTLSYLTLSYLT